MSHPSHFFIILIFPIQFEEQLPAKLLHQRLIWSEDTEIKHSDWLKLVTGFATSNQSALFQLSIVTL